MAKKNGKPNLVARVIVSIVFFTQFVWPRLIIMFYLASVGGPEWVWQSFLEDPIFSVFTIAMLIYILSTVLAVVRTLMGRRSREGFDCENTANTTSTLRPSDCAKQQPRGSRADRRHEAVMVGVPHDRRGRADELRDLLEAGIIEQQEYRERMAALK